MQHLLAETRQGRTAFVIGSEPMYRHVKDAGLRVAERHRPGLARRGRGRGRHGRPHLRRPQQRHAGGAPRAPTSWPPAAIPPTRCRTASGRAPARSWPPWRPPRARTASIVGKPEPQLFFTALDRLGEGRTLVIGDRLDTDVAGAAKAQARRRARADGRHQRRGGGGGEEAEARRGGGLPGGARPGLIQRVRQHRCVAAQDTPQAFVHQGLPPVARRARQDRRRAPGGDRPHQAAHGRRAGPSLRSPRSGAPTPGLSITINTDGAIVDAYVVTDRPEVVEAAMRERGWTAP